MQCINKKDVIYQELKERIISKKYAPETRLPKEVDFAKQLGVARITLRSALERLLTDGMIHRVPRKGTFVATASELHRCQHFTINPKVSTVGIYGIPLENIHGVFASTFVNALYSFGEENNCSLKILNADNMYQLENKGDCGYDLDCLYWISPTPEDIPQMEKIHHNGLNILAANRQLFGTTVPYVAIDQYSGTRELVTRLTRAGHRKIACITSDLPYRYISERWRGFCDALHEANIEIEERLVAHILDPGNLKDKLTKLFGKNSDMTGLFIIGEDFQQQTFEFIIQNDIHVPEDISIVAFDQAAKTLEGVQVVCLEQPVVKMVKEIYKMFGQMLDGEKNVHSKIIKPIIHSGNSIKKVNLE